MMLFQKDSYFGPPSTSVISRTAKSPATAPKGPTKRQLQDWIVRCRSMATEAFDNDLLELESSLLDLRDELTVELNLLESTKCPS